MKKSTNYFDLFFKTPVLIGFEPYASHEAFLEAHEDNNENKQTKVTKYFI
jgi:hypothetical protein